MTGCSVSTQGDDATLVKVVYHGKVPVAEICHEYVPDIRADRRVTVMYPLVKGSPNLNRGIFLGGWRGVILLPTLLFEGRVSFM